MLILDIPRLFQDSHIEIPSYHRPHLALASEAQVDLCLLPHQLGPEGSPASGTLPELIVSPIEFQVWQNIWRLSLFLGERIGALHDLCRIIERCGINILSAESSTIQARNRHYLEMMLDVNVSALVEIEIDEDDSQQFDFEASMRLAIDHLGWCIQSQLFNDLVFNVEGEPRLKLRPVRTLHQAKTAYLRQLRLGPLTAPFQPLLDRQSARLHRSSEDQRADRRLRISLSTDMRQALRGVRDTSTPEAKRLFYLRISDTKDRILRVLFFRGDDPVIHARIAHNERPGALATITGMLKNAGFDMLTSKSTLYEHNLRSYFEIVARLCTEGRRNIDEIKNKLEQALCDPCGEDLQMEIGYPQNYGPQWESKKLSVRKDVVSKNETPEEKEIERTNWQKELMSALETRHQHLHKKIQETKTPLQSVEKYQWALVNRLMSQQEKLTGKPIRKALFISCHFHDKGILKKVIEIAQYENLDFSCVTGEHLVAFPSMIKGLIEKISSCTHMIGIWSNAGAGEIGGERFPSPWLLWELGVANANNLHWRLLISDQLSEESWTKIKTEQQHALYSEADFNDKLRHVLSAYL